MLISQSGQQWSLVEHLGRKFAMVICIKHADIADAAGGIRECFAASL
jgi:hypothetical protein